MRFSGHETFICKQFWLKKGYDFLVAGNRFSNENAVVELGVGKNMVNAISFWMRAFGMCDDRWELSNVAHYLFDNEGRDKYLEDIGSIWLLHYFLVKKNYASIYHIFFNSFRREYIEFITPQLQRYIKLLAEENNLYNINTIKSDITVLLRMYQKADSSTGQSEIEDTYSSIFNDLQLIIKMRVEYGENGLVDLYRLSNDNRHNLPAHIFLFSILDNYPDEETIGFKQLEVGENSPGVIFALNREGLYSKIEEITEKYNQIVFSSNSGVQVLQFKSPINKWEILNDYYAER